MKKVIALTLTVGLLTACSQHGSGGGAPKAQGGDPSTQQFQESYQLKLNSCDTGKHLFGSDASYDDVKKQLCDALQDDELNSSCAEPLRKEFFDKKCGGMAWTPKYKQLKPNQPNTPVDNENDSIDYVTQEQVRNALSNVLVDKYEVSASLAAQEKKSATQLSEDMMSCGLSYLGPKCINYQNYAGYYDGELSKIDGKYIFYFEIKMNGAGSSLAMVFKFDQVQPSVKVSELEVLRIVKPRNGQALDQYLQDSSALTYLVKVTPADDFQNAATKRLQNPRDVRELYHVSKMLIELGMNGNKYQAVQKAVVNAITKNKALVIQTQDVRYQEEVLSFITSLINLKQEILVEICNGLLNSKSESVKQFAATVILDAQPSRSELKPIVIKTLKNSRWDIRTKAISALSNTQKTKDDENQLIAMIDDQVGVVSDKAIAAVKSITVNEENLSTIENLVSSQNWVVRREAAGLLSRVNSTKSIKSLISLMDDSVGVVQDEAYNQLNQKTLNDSFVGDLEQQLKSRNWIVRKNSIALLSKINSDLANTTMISYLDDSEGVVQDLIFEKLKVKDLTESYLPFLTKNYRSKNWLVRNQTSKLIGMISGTSATNALIAQMNDSVGIVQDTIQLQLTRRSLTDESVSPLAKNFKSQNWQVRLYVAKLLGKIKTTTSKEALEDQLTKENEGIVKDQIIASMKSIKG